MNLTCSFSTVNPAAADVDLLVVPVYANGELGPGAEVVAAAFTGAISDYMAAAGFAGKPGQILRVPVSGLPALSALLVGVGEREKVSEEILCRAAAIAVRSASAVSALATTLALAGPKTISAEAAAYSVAEGSLLGAYEFRAYKTSGADSELSQVVLLGTKSAEVANALKRAQVVAEAVIWARDLVNEPSGTKSPTEFATAANRLLSKRGVKVTVLNEAQIRAQKMGGVIGVGQGSVRPPRFVKAVYEPAGSKARGTLALVGKGVVFDTGGISIKPSDGMETMKTDMGGAAAVLGAMATLRALGVKHRVVAYTPMVENMPSGSAIRPGDVLKMRSGKTVEVLNTDAEGRLILADALSWADDDGADAIVDLATLTGACVVALGEKIAGLMGNDDDWSKQVQQAADRAGEPVWPLPLPEAYREQVVSEVADLRNITNTRWGGTLTAGLFLEEFVGDTPWVHLDIAGPSRANSHDGEMTAGGTGFGVRTLVELARTFVPPAKKAPAKKAPAKKAPAKKVAKKRPPVRR
jgi:leucyl aminopeptidase